MERKTWRDMSTCGCIGYNGLMMKFMVMVEDCQARRKAAIMRAAAATREAS